MLEITGIASEKQILSIFPDEVVITKGPVAVVECFQEIPCNPCTTSCRFDAIHIGKDINKTPKINYNNCIGCGICLAKCPGLAIMLIDGSKSNEYLHIGIPYEFVPLPEINTKVKALDREGNYICDVEVLKIQNPKSYDKTAIVTLKVPKEYIYRFRNIRVG
jgi:Fe-S-cluster-containing hydrogenase component 2